MTAVAAAHSRTADALARGCRMVPAASLTDVVQAGSVGVRGGPAEAGELARDGDRDDRAALATLAVLSAPGAVQALLRVPADRDDVRGLSGLAALECLALGRGSSVVPRGFDEQPAAVPAAGLRDQGVRPPVFRSRWAESVRVCGSALERTWG